MTPNPTTPVDVAEGRRLLEAVCAAHAHGGQATADCPDPRAIREAADSAWTTWLFENSAALLRAASERDAAVREAERLRDALKELAEPPGPHADEIAWNMAERAEQILASAAQGGAKSVDATEGRLGGAK